MAYTAVFERGSVEYDSRATPSLVLYDNQGASCTPAVSEAIEKIGEAVLTIWQQRQNIKDQVMEKSDPSRRKRDIFYDTDGIQETQHEQIQICPNCAGALRIDSTSSRGFHILR